MHNVLVMYHIMEGQNLNELLIFMMPFSERLNVLYERNWTLLVHEQLRRFEGSIVAATKTGLVEALGNDHRLGAQKWSFTEALIYSVTVITTIGHGNLTPRTTEGKIVTMVYALIGVPLMLLCLSSLGGRLAEALQNAYAKLCPTQASHHRCREKITGGDHPLDQRLVFLYRSGQGDWAQLSKSSKANNRRRQARKRWRKGTAGTESKETTVSSTSGTSGADQARPAGGLPPSSSAVTEQRHPQPPPVGRVNPRARQPPPATVTLGALSRLGPPPGATGNAGGRDVRPPPGPPTRPKEKSVRTVELTPAVSTGPPNRPAAPSITVTCGPPSARPATKGAPGYGGPTPCKTNPRGQPRVAHRGHLPDGIRAAVPPQPTWPPAVRRRRGKARITPASAGLITAARREKELREDRSRQEQTSATPLGRSPVSTRGGHQPVQGRGVLPPGPGHIFRGSPPPLAPLRNQGGSRGLRERNSPRCNTTPPALILPGTTPPPALLSPLGGTPTSLPPTSGGPLKKNRREIVPFRNPRVLITREERQRAEVQESPIVRRRCRRTRISRERRSSS
ncbi:uncharacterized protein DMENIID0001_127150 [Sergentomyia squamirostris]